MTDRDLAALGRERDVGAVVRALEPDPVNGAVCAVARLRQIGAGRDDGQDAPTRGHEGAVLADGCSRMQDVGVVADLVEALDDVAGAG